MIEMADKKLKVGNVPPLRFPEFEGEWETKKLHEVMDFKVTNSFSRENLNYEVGTVKNIHYGDIHTKFQTLFDITNETVPYINEELNIEKIAEQNYCEEGDIIFADASEDLLDVGKSIEIVNLNKEKLLSGLHTLLARPEKGIFCLGFNGHLFKSNFVRTQIQKEAQGTKVLSINTGRISKIDLSYPDIKEQAKITLLLSLIDERIQTQNKIIEQYETLIKGIGEKLFSQQFKFSGFTENWNSKKLGEIFYSEKGRGLSKEKVQSDGKYECILYGELYTKYKEVIVDIKSKTNEEDGLKSQIGDLLIPSSTTTTGIDLANVTAINKENVLLGGDITILRSKEEINNVFYAYYLSNYKKEEIANYAQGTTIVHLYYYHIRNMLIDFPPMEEQTIISQFLLSIDSKIKLENNILEQYQFQKQFLLQNLFI
jgi:type I restriction enzyme S subunit